MLLVRKKEKKKKSFLVLAFMTLIFVCLILYFLKWMLFFTGLVLFFSLPRHIFGKVQKCLFPKYFMLNSLLSAITLALFILHHPSTAQGELKVQVISIFIIFFYIYKNYIRWIITSANRSDISAKLHAYTGKYTWKKFISLINKIKLIQILVLTFNYNYVKIRNNLLKNGFSRILTLLRFTFKIYLINIHRIFLNKFVFTFPKIWQII